jgi:hypothetical protein
MNHLLVSTVASTMNINHEAKLNPRADTEPELRLQAWQFLLQQT